MLVSTSFLKSLDACAEDVELFAATFPDGCEVTRDNLLTALRLGLDIEWFGEKVFGAPYIAAMAGPKAAFAAAIVEPKAVYGAAMASAGEAYRAALAESRSSHDATRLEKQAVAKMTAAMAEARAVYDAARDAARSVYHAAAIDVILSLVHAGSARE